MKLDVGELRERLRAAAKNPARALLVADVLTDMAVVGAKAAAGLQVDSDWRHLEAQVANLTAAELTVGAAVVADWWRDQVTRAAAGVVAGLVVP